MTAAPQVPATKPRRGPKLREARFEDYQQIAALESRFKFVVKPYNEWVHLWQGNPVYRELKTDWPIGWVLEDQDGKIVGSMGNIPSLYELGGRKILAASSHAWVADVKYRAAAFLLVNKFMKQRYVDLYLNTTISPRSLPVTSLWCSPMPVGVWDEVAYWITNYRGFFERIVGMKTYSLTKPFAFPSWGGSWTRPKALRARLAKPLSYPLSAAAFLKDRLAKTSVREGDVEVKLCTDFDDRFDSFWEDVKKNNRHLLLAVRTREVLEWHFKDALLHNRLWIVTAVDGPRLVAYAIFDKSVNSRSGSLKRVQLVDYQSLEDGASMLAPLLAWTLRRCRSEGVHVLEYTGRWMEKGQFIETAAPYRRKMPVWSYFYHANNPELRGLMNSRQVWTPSLFDGDATLY